MFLRSRRRRRCGSRAISIYPLLLLAGDRPSLALAGAGVGVGALTADRQALAVAQAAIAGQIHQPLDVHRRLAAEVTLHRMVGVDRLAQMEHLLVGEILDPPLGRDAELGGDLLRLGAADAVDVSQRDFDALVGRDIDARDTCHGMLFSCSTERLAHLPISALRWPETAIADARTGAPPVDRLSG